MEKPVSTSAHDIPQVLTDFVHESIQSMDERQLRSWKRESNKIMRKAKRRVAAAALTAVHEKQLSASEVR
jgi:hypothetical protein